MVPCEYRPCLVRDALIAALPSSVGGPVEGPPCIRHRPFGIADAEPHLAPPS